MLSHLWQRTRPFSAQRLKHFVQMPCFFAKRRSSLSTSSMRFVIISPGVPMANMSEVVELLKKEGDRVHEEVQRIDAALAALGSVTTNGTRPRTMSAAARRRISLAQKARWAKRRAPKRTISAAGRRRIAAALRARRAKVKRG